MSGPSYNNFLFAAKNVLRALEDIGETSCCLVGGMAVSLWGVNREVKDLDILILDPETADPASIQEALVNENPKSFYLTSPKDPNATFMKLYYRIPRTKHVIKVDLLLSSEEDLETPTTLRSNHFKYIDRVPVAPLHFVLYHKLMGWEKRTESEEAWKRRKAESTDYRDIIELCGVSLDMGLKPLSQSHMGRYYLDSFESRAETFVGSYGRNTRKRFRKIGFPV